MAQASSSNGGGTLPQSVQKCLDDQGLLYLWGKIKGSLALKVDKLDGFALSSNDFTSAEKAKLQAYPEYSALNADITNRLSTLQTAMDSKMANVYKFKGSVASYANLPSSGLTAGDVYNVQDSEMNYAWTGTAWDQLGSSQINLQTITNAEIDTIVANATSGSGDSGGGASGSSNGSLVRYSYFTGTGTKLITLDNPFGMNLTKVELFWSKDEQATATRGYTAAHGVFVSDPLNNHMNANYSTYPGLMEKKTFKILSTSGGDPWEIYQTFCLMTVKETTVDISVQFAGKLSGNTTSNTYVASNIYNYQSNSDTYGTYFNALNPKDIGVKVRMEGISNYRTDYVKNRTQATVTQWAGGGVL